MNEVKGLPAQGAGLGNVELTYLKPLSVQKTGFEVGGHDTPFGSDFAVEPTCNGAAARTDFEAVPSLRDPDCLEPARRDVVPRLFEPSEPLLLLVASPGGKVLVAHVHLQSFQGDPGYHAPLLG